jgi:signal transduction histidine kinase
MLQRWLPQSLFGRLVLVLAGGLLVAQLLSAAINLAERDRLLLRAGGMQQAQRIADAVRLLDPMAPAERERVAAVLSAPPLVLSLHARPGAPEAAAADAGAANFTSLLQDLLGEDRAVRVEPGPAWAMPAGAGPRHAHGYGRMGAGPGYGPGRGAPMGAAGTVLRTEVQLRDGQWARFDTELPAGTAGLSWRLAASLAILLAAVLLLSLLAVRWLIRPLHVLAQAADGLGKDIHRPPLREDGPREIRQAARAFNTMQGRLQRFIEDRTRMLAAMSHDLKTPITRMRLRAELLGDEELRQRFEADLVEMQAMVTDTLEFMRGLGGGEPRQPVDMLALLESLRSDNEAMGRTVRIEGRPLAPFAGVPSLLKRCLANLVENAVLYGGAATVRIEDGPGQLTLRVLDEGPGIPPDQLEAVFEPFYRLEASRSRETGGTGLGLAIARNIAQVHEGDIQLRNRPEGGLEVVLRLPRQPAG